MSCTCVWFVGDCVHKELPFLSLAVLVMRRIGRFVGSRWKQSLQSQSWQSAEPFRYPWAMDSNRAQANVGPGKRRKTTKKSRETHRKRWGTEKKVANMKKHEEVSNKFKQEESIRKHIHCKKALQVPKMLRNATSRLWECSTSPGLKRNRESRELSVLVVTTLGRQCAMLIYATFEVGTVPGTPTSIRWTTWTLRFSPFRGSGRSDLPPAFGSAAARVWTTTRSLAERMEGSPNWKFEWS